jgi:hypothetical protein
MRTTSAARARKKRQVLAASRARDVSAKQALAACMHTYMCVSTMNIE